MKISSVTIYIKILFLCKDCWANLNSQDTLRGAGPGVPPVVQRQKQGMEGRAEGENSAAGQEGPWFLGTFAWPPCFGALE